MTLTNILILVSAYLIGALPSAYLAGKRHGVHLREVGDGNLGTQNTYRVLGLKPALCVGALDIGKGALATWLATVLSDDPLVPYVAALSAAIGHDFSLYIRFAGGKGMATVLGSVLVLQPVESLLGLGLVGLALLLLRNWDLAWSLGMGSMLAWSFYLRRPPWQSLWLVILFVSIGVKKLIDIPHARKVRQAAATASHRDANGLPVDAALENGGRAPCGQGEAGN
jgi:glycerol-3-phosphate acyltransferase PlsY